jgi:hypothetical protein
MHSTVNEVAKCWRFQAKSVYIKSVGEPVGWGQETYFIWFGTSVQTMEHIFLPRKLTVYNSYNPGHEAFWLDRCPTTYNL